MEMLTLKELSTADSMIVQLTIEADAVKDVMAFVEDSFEGYYTTKALKGKRAGRKPGLYARMSADGIYTVVSSCPKGTESTAVGLKSGDDEVMSARVAHDGERNDRSRGVEIINFMPSGMRHSRRICRKAYRRRDQGHIFRRKEKSHHDSS